MVNCLHLKLVTSGGFHMKRPGRGAGVAGSWHLMPAWSVLVARMHHASSVDVDVTAFLPPRATPCCAPRIQSGHRELNVVRLSKQSDVLYALND